VIIGRPPSWRGKGTESLEAPPWSCIEKWPSCGFSLEEIGEILKLSRSGRTPCSRVLDLARRHLAAVETRIEHLARFRDVLAREISKWDGQQAPTCTGLCRIIASADGPSVDVQSDLHARPPAPSRRLGTP